MPDLSADLASLRIDRGSSSPSPQRPHRWVGLILLLGVLGALGWRGAGWLGSASYRTVVDIGVVAPNAPSSAGSRLEASGYVAAERVSRATPLVSGRVLHVHVKQGEQVDEDAPILTLDPSDIEAQILAAKSRVRAAEAQAATAEAEVASAQALAAETEQQASRAWKLADARVGTRASAEDLDARVQSVAKSVLVAEASVRAMRANVEARMADVRVLEAAQEKLVLRSPLRGTVMNKPPTVGDRIDPHGGDPFGIEVADLESLTVDADIPERRISLVEVGGPAKINLDAFPGEVFEATVDQVTPHVDRGKATVLVKVKFKTPRPGVLPQMSARVTFLRQRSGEPSSDGSVVPKSAIVKRGGQAVVFVVEGERARMVPVTPGPKLKQGVQISDGPANGTLLVLNPSPTMKDGERIQRRSKS